MREGLSFVLNKKSQSQQSCGVFFNLAWNQHRSRTTGYHTQARNKLVEENND